MVGNDRQSILNEQLADDNAVVPTIADHLSGNLQAFHPTDMVGMLQLHRRTKGIESGRAVVTPSIPVTAEVAALSFACWAAVHHISKPLPVEQLWHLASQEFALVYSLILPPRRVFLGALKKVQGVIAKQDQRQYNRIGEMVRKTTVYILPMTLGVSDDGERAAKE